MKIRRLGIWLGFDYKLPIKREGIARFVYYLVKHLIKNYKIMVEIWCYSYNHKEILELFSELLMDRLYNMNIKIITEKEFNEHSVSRIKVLKNGLNLMWDILRYDKGISWKQPYRYYRSYYPLRISLRKEIAGEGFKLNEYIMYVLIDLINSILMVAGGIIARVIRKTVLKNESFIITRKYREYRATELPCMTGTNEGSERVAREGRDKEGNIIYGPYERLGKGYYEVELEYSFEGSKDFLPIWDLVVHKENGINIVTGGNLEDGRGRVKREVIYINQENAGMPVEVRVWYKGRGELRVSKVRINVEEKMEEQKNVDILTVYANKHSEADCFLVPIAVLYNALQLNKKKVITIHDLVQFEFYELFLLDNKINNNWLSNYKDILRRFAAQGCFFCSNSDYVRKMHTLKYIDNVREENTGFVYIPVNIPENIHKRILSKEIILKKYQIHGEYIFYPTQIRPYKNLITLLKALKILNNKGVDIYLVLTGNPNDSPTCQKYIEENRLKDRIILTGDVPEVDLYSLHKHALATVVPTLFEGGFPWQGLEAMLMDTPAIMSRIPVVLERLKFAGIDTENCGLKLFNPVNEYELVEKILEVLENRNQAVTDQLPVKEKLFAYNWDDVSHQYYKIFTEKVLK